MQGLLAFLFILAAIVCAIAAIVLNICWLGAAQALTVIGMLVGAVVVFVIGLAIGNA